MGIYGPMVPRSSVLPMPFGKFPPIAVSLGAGVKMNGALVIPARFILIDTVTGYRSQSQDYSTIIFAR